MVTQKWIKPFINDEQIKTIEDKIAKIENQCDVEIVPVVVKSSSSYPQTGVTLFLVLTLIFVPLFYILDPDLYWNAHPSWMPFNKYWAITGLALLMTLLIPYLSRFGLIKMWMSHRDLENEQCFKRAELEFYKEKLQSSEKQNGLLIFISMLEHRVILRSDEALQNKIQDQEFLNTSVALIIKELKKKNLAAGLMLALENLEAELKIKAPLNSPPENLLPNRLIIKE